MFHFIGGKLKNRFSQHHQGHLRPRLHFTSCSTLYLLLLNLENVSHSKQIQTKLNIEVFLDVAKVLLVQLHICSHVVTNCTSVSLFLFILFKHAEHKLAACFSVICVHFFEPWDFLFNAIEPIDDFWEFFEWYINAQKE